MSYTSLESKLNVKKAATFESTVWQEGASNLKGAASLKDTCEVDKSSTVGFYHMYVLVQQLNGNTSLRDILETL